MDADRYTGTTATTFELSAEFVTSVTARGEFRWEVGDGRVLTGQRVSVTYPVAGTYTVTVTVPVDGGTATASELLQVLDPTSPSSPFGTAQPALPGDVDLDGALSLRDAQLVRQHLSGRSLLATDAVAGQDFSAFELADFDRDGDVDDVDADLLAKAFLGGEDVPLTLEPAAAMPGTVVTIYAPELLDPAALVELKIGTFAAFEPIRVVFGQSSFLVPLDVLTPGVPTETAGQVDIALLVNGAVAQTLVLDVLAPPPLPPEGVAALGLASDFAAQARAQVAGELGNWLAAVGEPVFGLDAQQSSVLSAWVATSLAQASEVEAEVGEVIDALSPSQKEAVLRVAMANGLGDVLDVIRGGTAAPLALSNDALAAFCALEDAKANLELAQNVTTYSCTAVAALAVAVLFGSTIGIAFPEEIVTVPGLLAASAKCAEALALQEAAGLVLSLIPSIGGDLQLQADGSTTLQAGESVTITASLTVSNLSAICAEDLSTSGDDGLEEQLAEILTERLKKRAPLRQVFTAAQNISSTVAEQLEEAVEDAVQVAVGATVGGVIGAAIGAFCDAVEGALSPQFEVDPALLSTTLTPSTPDISVAPGAQGLLVSCSDTATDSTTATLKVTLDLCSEPRSGEIGITCGETQSVTFTIGDNGSALDDIFQLRVDGVVVLTSSVPVTSTSTTIELTVGDHLVQMDGLAAPDGISTYFINVVGGTLTNGPPQSGSNLTAGTSFQWTLVVN